MLIILLLTNLIVFVNSSKDSSDIFAAHGGVFRYLNWTSDELAMVSSLHTTASYHQLMKLVAQKISESNIHKDVRRRIEKFMVQRRPPKFLETFLTAEDRNTLLQRHADGDFHQYAIYLFKRLFDLPKRQAITALRYFGHIDEADDLEEAECYECAVIRLSERLAR